MPGGKPNEGLIMAPYTLYALASFFVHASFRSVLVSAAPDFLVHFSDNNDFKMWLGQVGSDDAFAQHCIDSFT